MKFDNMVASDSMVTSVWFIVVAFSLVSYPSPTEGKGLTRSRRQETNMCVDDIYEHNGRNCCLCGAGQRVKDHCTTNKDSVCDHCPDKTYSSHPNSQTSCEPCTQCNDNANLEVHEPCQPDKDTVCRCKKGHYCGGEEQPCKRCYPCNTCEANGIKVACTATNNTVCNDKREGGNNSTIILGIVIPILIILVIVFILLWRRRTQKKTQKANGKANDVEMQPLNPLIVQRVDLTPYLADIAEMIGWNDMKVIAIRTGILQTTIDDCQLDNPNQAHQQTIQLLKTWVEKQGMEASVKLIQNLEKSGKRLTAEKVIDILSAGGNT